ncbi:helix-turn-helix domain-containing protein [Actinomadura flavalba]|uniref:helix-turn-helix domain-containing protein n=1 Tax=Actinomadura flavalba TaxID=1120938 RepID=UPI00036E62A3|nr:RodZ domain-containing protein [Actinomadura flavalba]
MSIGETLAEERRQAGLTVTQVSHQTRIRESVIRAIEKNDFTSCGGNFYARGHIRSIARVVGADPEPLVRAFDDANGGAPAPVSVLTAFEPERPVAFKERRAPNWTAAMGVALGVLVLVGVFQLFGSGGSAQHTARQVATTPSAAPATTPPPRQDAAPAPAPEAVELRVKAREMTWVRVRGDKNRELYTGVLKAGVVREWKASKRIVIEIGNGRGVKLTVNGKNLGYPAKNGAAVRLKFTPKDPEPA